MAERRMMNGDIVIRGEPAAAGTHTVEMILPKGWTRRGKKVTSLKVAVFFPHVFHPGRYTITYPLPADVHGPRAKTKKVPPKRVPKRKPGEPPYWIADRGIWAEAEAKVLAEEADKPKARRYPEPYRVVVARYRNLGGRKQDHAGKIIPWAQRAAPR